MDFIDQLRLLASRISSSKDMIQTEEATKTAMILPFINALGYNPFDPYEVTPELIADVGTKKGEKVDYAILKDGKPIIIFECKKAGADLNINHASQLFRYFHVTEARFAVLTNGINYKFFTDLEQPNKMDERPFLEFNILDFKDRDIEELKKFAKTAFDVDSILCTASDLKYTRIIQGKISDWIAAPSEDFVRLVAADLIGTKRFTPAVKEQFTLLTKRAFEQAISERINDRLKGAMSIDAAPSAEKPAVHAEKPVADCDEQKVVTTSEEIEAFYAIRAMLRDTIQPQRIVMRDAQSYCAILLDDNNRRPICRLRFNNQSNLKLSLFSSGKEEETVPLSCVDDIFNHMDRLKSAATFYDSTKE